MTNSASPSMAIPSNPSCAPLAETSGIVSTVLIAPLSGLIRSIFFPVFAVTQRKLSGPQSSSHGLERPLVRTRITGGGPSAAAGNLGSWATVGAGFAASGGGGGPVGLEAQAARADIASTHNINSGDRIPGNPLLKGPQVTDN